LAIQQELRKRRFAGSPVRLEVHASMPSNINKMVMQGG